MTPKTTGKSAAAQRRKKRRRKQIRRTLMLVALMGVLLLGGVTALYILQNRSIRDELQPFSVDREFPGQLTAGGEQTAQAFAEDLCVVRKDVDLESVELEREEKGVLLDLTRERVMFSKGAFDRIFPASITKIMTGILALEYGHGDQVVTITKENVTLEEGSQVCGFREGDRVSMDELVHGLLVYSGNDAASAIATQVAGSEAAFVEQMNQKAKEIGCTGTHFTNPHGLHDENHYTTPYDIYLMLDAAMDYPEFTEITRMPSYVLSYTRADGTPMSVPLEATDLYLIGDATAPRDVTVLAGKTGTTSKAGNCLALLCQNGWGQPYIAILTGASSKTILYGQMNSLLEQINRG